uniref:glycosyltransferase family 4 protein n=1 Tax=Acetatifactor sp. TaxID=1872090 RepID=UPI004057A01F
MRILWLCNIMLPVIAEHLNREATNKEGWLSGLSDVVLSRQQENDITLAIAFPAPKELIPAGSDVYEDVIDVKGSKLYCYGFYEDTTCPDRYDDALEPLMLEITKRFRPDVIHCYGTEYPHTLAMCRAFPQKEKILISIQGLCAVYANTYFANLPKQVIKSVTLRDFLKKDSIVEQYEKFVRRGEMEIEAVRLAGNVTGRTDWDLHYTKEWNPDAKYYAMNETLRGNFYEGEWQEEKCVPYSIFLSQGDYPIKGLHYMLLALPAIKKQYPQVKVYVAGNSIVNNRTLKDKLKISAYGKYLLGLIRQEKLEENVEFLGRLNAEQMKEQYLKSHLFVCCSTIENSPNSLGEAMILGVPCVSAQVGGIASIFTDGKDGILYPGYKTVKNSFDNMCNYKEETEEEQLKKNAAQLANAVIEMWGNREKLEKYRTTARKHAKTTHNKEENYRKMTEIYAKIAAGGEE